MDDDRHAERGGDRIDGDVVMGRADAAGGEQIIVARRAARSPPRRSARSIVGHDPHLGQPDALQVQPGRDLGDIAVLGPARQDLVADHEQRRRPDPFVAIAPIPSQSAFDIARCRPCLYRRR